MRGRRRSCGVWVWRVVWPWSFCLFSCEAFKVLALAASQVQKYLSNIFSIYYLHHRNVLTKTKNVEL